MITKAKNPISSFFADPNRLERIWLLAKVDFKKRYYESKLGLVWAFINPAFKVCIYYLAFTYLVDIGIENFALYLFSGLITWMFFTEGTSKSLSIFRSKKYLIDNIQFNIIDIFISLIVSVSIGYIFNFFAYYVLSLIAGIPLYSGIIWVPLLILNLAIITLGFGMITACISLYFKDLKHLWALVILAGFWSAPIFFRGEAIAENFPYLVYIHPASGIITNIRNAVFYGVSLDWWMFAYNFCYGFIFFAIGLMFLKYSIPHISERL